MPADWLIVIGSGITFWLAIVGLNCFFIVWLLAMGLTPPLAPCPAAVLFALQASLMEIWNIFTAEHPRLAAEETALAAVLAGVPAGIVAGLFGTAAGLAALLFWGAFICSIPAGHKILFRDAKSLRPSER